MKLSCRAFQFCTVAWLAFLPVVDADATEKTFSVELQAEREHTKVADPVWVTLSATAPKGWNVEFPETPDAFGQLTVTETVEHREDNDSGTFTATLRYQLESLLPGSYQVGPLDVRLIPEIGGESQRSAETIERSTSPVTIRVRSALGFFETRRLRDIDGLVRVPWTWRQWAVVAMATIILVAAGWGIHRGVDHWLRSRRTNQRSLLRQLDRLDEGRLARTISNDQFIIAVADVLRQSLRLAEGTRPAYRTTNEWIDYFERQRSAGGTSSVNDPSVLLDAVAMVLREADAVKFAGKAATLDQTRRSLDAARTTVRTFLQQEAPPAQRGSTS